MKTGKTDLRKEMDDQSKKELFKDIFILQMNLGRCEALEYQDEVNEVIRTMEDLMQAMIDR